MSSKFVLAALIGSVFFASPSSAQPIADVRCLLLSNAFSHGATTPEAKKAAGAGALFYLGRIDGRMSDADLRAAIVQLQKTIDASKAGPEMGGCLRRMQVAAEKVQVATSAAAKRPR